MMAILVLGTLFLFFYAIRRTRRRTPGATARWPLGVGGWTADPVEDRDNARVLAELAAQPSVADRGSAESVAGNAATHQSVPLPHRPAMNLRNGQPRTHLAKIVDSGVGVADKAL